jgi:hypothetical protein
MLVAGIQGNHPGSGAVLHSWLQDILALVSGGAVGLSLSVIGGGGSILAVPLLLYVVGVADVHVAIGTSALAVATNALANFLTGIGGSATSNGRARRSSRLPVLSGPRSARRWGRSSMAASFCPCLLSP